jgi:starvation-inducible DNA-binding protein
MVEHIVADHEAVVRNLRDDIKTVGEECDDVAAEDFLTGLLQDHQKFAWMARAMIGKPTP